MSSKFKSIMEVNVSRFGNKSLHKIIPKQNGLYARKCPNQTIPASYWENPHICYKGKTFPNTKPGTKRIPRTQIPETPRSNGVYSCRTVPASFWNNPHVRDRVKAPNVYQEPKKSPWTQQPRWEIRQNILKKKMIREERMKEDRNRFLRLRAMKYGLKQPSGPVEGRKNAALQTCDYLEALYDDPPTTNSCTQADLERPLTPPFIPAKTGIDTCTQIYPDDLFYFDEEVKPILHVTVGRTLEQALLEVLHEDEIDGMKKEKRRFFEEKDTIEAEVQRLEEEEQRREAEVKARMAEMEIAKEAQKKLEECIAAAMLSEQICKEWFPAVLDEMVGKGYYVDATEDAIEDVMKDLESDVCEEFKKIALSEDVLSGMIKDLAQERYDVYHELGDHPVQRFTREVPEEEEEHGVGEGEAEGSYVAL